MSIEIEERCARLLRELRRRKGLTLNDCELRSHGDIKAVVLGSYERGSRAISLARLQQLATFYEVPIEYFFSTKEIESNSENLRMIFDLRRIRVLQNLDPAMASVKRYLAAIAKRRGDWNGEVISLRTADCDLLSLFNEMESAELFQQLRLAGFLFASEASEPRSL